ncbi:MAG TPA: hypothetical protein VEY30_07765, partial [Myxococcaceae bacterium]|nr:hypothetical protein [Myxococcaceae bacterium]
MSRDASVLQVARATRFEGLGEFIGQVVTGFVAEEESGVGRFAADLPFSHGNPGVDLHSHDLAGDR